MTPPADDMTLSVHGERFILISARLAGAIGRAFLTTALDAQRRNGGGRLVADIVSELERMAACDANVTTSVTLPPVETSSGTQGWLTTEEARVHLHWLKDGGIRAAARRGAIDGVSTTHGWRYEPESVRDYAARRSA